MRITLNLNTTLEKSAGTYFDKAKKSRKKALSAQEAIETFKQELSKLEKKQDLEKREIREKKTVPEEWYEKFRWFISSEGFLCIGGRDATSNEIVVKKHTDANDLVFHTEAPGSPFFVVKTEGKKPTVATKKEIADATASYSKAWKLGVSAVEVYEVAPDQVSKQAPSGEYMPKGAFMIRGKRTYHAGTVGLAVGMLPDGRVMCGPETAVKEHCKTYALLRQGRNKPSDCAKRIARYLHADVDHVLKVLPAGTSEVSI